MCTGMIRDLFQEDVGNDDKRDGNTMELMIQQELEKIEDEFVDEHLDTKLEQSRIHETPVLKKEW